MADDKRVEIKLQATGGDQAANEIKKVTQANEEAASSAAELSSALGNTQTISSKKGRSGKGVAAASEEAARSMPKVTSTSQNTGQALLQLAYFSDDVQYGFRGIVNNIPQLVASLGLGSGVAGVAGIAAVAINQLVTKTDLLTSADEKNAAANKELADGLAEVSKKRQELQRTRGEEAGQAFIDNLDSQTAAVSRLNEAQQRAIDLARERHRAEVETQNAQAALELAKIDASDAPESVKIQRRAEINKAVTFSKAQEDYQAQDARARDAQRAADEALAKVNSGVEDSKKLIEERDRLQKEYADAKGKIESADRSRAAVPILEGQLKQLEDSRQRVMAAYAQAGQSPPAGTALEYGQKEKALRDQIDAATEAGRPRQDLQDRVANYDADKKKIDQGIIDAQKKIAGMTEEATKLADIAKETQKTSSFIQAQINKKLGIDLEKQSVTSDYKSAEAAKKEQEKADREKEQEKRKSDQEDRRVESEDERRRGAGRQAAEVAYDLSGEKRMNPKQRKYLEGVGDRLRNNPQASDFDLLERVIQQLEARDKGNATEVERRKKLERRVEDLERNFKSDRGRGGR